MQKQKRRQFLKTTGTAAAAATMLASAQTYAHAAEDNTIQLALVGCGGRGTGAAHNALSAKAGPTKLVAMAVALALTLPWVITRLTEYVQDLITDIPYAL